ncbi:NPCBM/NEW2 domain-containing protein [Bacillus massiliigorillae]|uniref:NPCBM/NEW2 domain-containing protein n=1 Tax=Bacillus massiliigorillae TaxID=1243664 RepID=UPI0003A1A7C7|nr:NPCBM/NEW2 domain-containing protein [Bacillus massiliigorillae]
MKVVAVATIAAMLVNGASVPINVLAHEVADAKIVTTVNEGGVKQSISALVSKFDLYSSDLYNTYNDVYKMNNSNIESISNNGGNYPGSPIEKAIDGDMNTHWETGRANNATFTNEMVFKFREAITLDRIVYAARQSSAKGKGFAQEFDIYASTTDEGEDYTFVSTGEYKGSTGDIVEIQFKTTEFKRLKFVYKKANQDWASAAEFQFYKEDSVSDKIKNLFKDDTLSSINEEFNSVEALNKLTEEAKNHPLYPLFKEDIENAKLLLNQQEIEATTAKVSKLKGHGTDFEQAYSAVFRMPNSNVSKVTTNGGSYPGTKPEYMLDDQPNTHWETNKNNDTNFTNEIIFELEQAEVLDRIAFLARSVNQKGFPEEFEIYGSETSKGETFQLVSSGTAVRTSDFLEFKFQPTKFKRIKFAFKKAYTNRPFAAEFRFYKEDALSNKMENLFTDGNKNQVSEHYNTVEKLQALEKSVRSHPLYEEFKEDIQNAFALINGEKIEPTKAVTKSFDYYSKEDYSKLYRMSYENIKSIRNNAGNWASQVIQNAIDGDLNTYWETNKGNSNDFSNEVEVEFKEAVELNRIMYGARPSDRKGFAEEFEIYASQTSQGDTYQLVASGQHKMVAGLVEAKFQPTTFKRVKFKFNKSNQNWATLSELAFYKEDAIEDKVNNIFTDGTMSAVVPEFNSVAKINALEKEAKSHPLYSILKERLDLAKKLVNGEVATEGRIIRAEQHGNMVKHANDNLKFGLGNNFQPTGLAAKPGEKVTIYLEADSNGPLPQIAFAQQEGSFANWARTVNLQPGKNEITVPEIPADSWYKNKVTKGGTIYIVNPYTPEQQSQAPIIRIEGGERIPFVTQDTDPEEFKSFLIDYKKRLELDAQQHPNVEDRELIDVVEVVSDHLVFTGTATGAYKTYITDGYNPLDTVKSYNKYMNEIFNFYGLDGSNEKNDPKFIRENIRLAQPYGYMYAYTNHVGVQGDVMVSMLVPMEKSSGWGVAHEIGHRMDVNARLYGEITNNMIPMYMSVFYGRTDQRIPYENKIYKNVINENSKSYQSQELAERLGVFWQIEMYHKGYWGELNKLYRERDIQLDSANTENSKMQYLVELSSEVVGQDLSEHFARHGFEVNPETKEKVSKYPKPKNVWYLNNSVIDYEDTGFAKDASFDVSLTRNQENKTNTLYFNMNKKDKEDLLGYEIIRNGEVVGFTANTTFVDQNIEPDENYTYEIVAYDKKLNTLKPVEFKAFKPTISVEDHVTLKLRQKFDPMNYVKAANYQGDDITEDVVIKANNVDITKKGNYEIVYEVKNANAKEIKTTKVTVTSDYTYISDMDAKLANIAWGGLKKDLAPAGSAITLVRQGLDATYSKGIGAHANSEVVYDIDGKGFDFFESYIGIDQAMKGRPSSATFEVWVDGEKKFTSDVFKVNNEHEFVKVPVAGAKEVKLVTTDAENNGNTADHTVWADAKFTQNASKPILTLTEDFSMVKLNSDFDFLKGVEAFDAEDGDLINQVKVTANGFNPNKSGMYNVEYSVTDEDGNTVTKAKQVYVYSDIKYATDTDWKSAQTAWQTVNKDKASSGGAIKLLVNGETKEFAKGIGTHANSEIVYDLKGKNYDYFETLVGVDRNISENNKSSVTFKVLADGEEVYNSGVMRYNTDAKVVRVPLKGVKELKLIANDSSNGNESDHADFADAKFYISNGLPELTIPKSVATKVGTPIDINEQYTAIDAEDGDLTSAVHVTGADQVNFNRAGKYEITYTVTDSDGNEVTKKRTVSVVNMEDYKYLSDFDWKSTQNSYTAPRKDISISGKALRLSNEDGSEVVYEKGIGAHSNSMIVYDLTDKDADYFTSYVGVDRQMYGSVGSVIFQVYVDGEKQFDSGLMNSRDPQKFIEVNISGAKELKLVVTDGGNGNGSDHATWGDTKLHFANADRVFTQNLEDIIAEAKTINAEDYTKESMDVLLASLAKAEDVLANKQSTQAEIDQATLELQQVKDNLIEIDLSKIITIKDKDLKASIKETLGITGEITLSDMYKLTTLISPGTGKTRVTSLEGLEYAKNLVTLDISGNEVTDFSPLKELSKLETLLADPQIIEMPSVNGENSIFTIENVVKGLDGKKVNPYLIGLRNTKTFKEISLDVEQLEPNAEQFTIDLSEEDKGYYMLVFAYKVKTNLVQIVTFIENK